MTTISITGITDSEAKRILHILHENQIYGEVTIRSNKINRIFLSKRTDIIMQTLSIKPMNQLECYHNAKRIGYPMKYRTFQRDIDRLADKGLINKQVKQDGSGRYAQISKP